jgi:hypothetical protein
VRDTAGNLTGNGQPERINGLRVGANFLSILREQPKVGRGFLPEEELPGSDDKVVLSHGLWQRRFGGDTNLVGNPIWLDGERRIVVGVLRPKALATESEVDFLIPFDFRTKGTVRLPFSSGNWPAQVRRDSWHGQQQSWWPSNSGCTKSIRVERGLVSDGGANERRGHR